MKKLIAVAGLGAAVALGSLMGAGTASADASYDNYLFLQGLNNNGVYVTNTAGAISHGHTICAMLDSGSSPYDAQQWLYYVNPPLAWRGAYNEVGVAVNAYCPQHNDVVYAPDSY